MTERYCPRCVIMFEIARDPSRAMHIVLPPHDPECPNIMAKRPLPLPSSRFGKDLRSQRDVGGHGPLRATFR